LVLDSLILIVLVLVGMVLDGLRRSGGLIVTECLTDNE
jgi:hypothetical protein